MTQTDNQIHAQGRYDARRFAMTGDAPAWTSYTTEDQWQTYWRG